MPLGIHLSKWCSKHQIIAPLSVLGAYNPTLTCDWKRDYRLRSAFSVLSRRYVAKSISGPNVSSTSMSACCSWSSLICLNCLNLSTSVSIYSHLLSLPSVRFLSKRPKLAPLATQLFTLRGHHDLWMLIRCWGLLIRWRSLQHFLWNLFPDL